MANYLLKQGEFARTVTTILWVEPLQRLYGDKWESKLHGYLAGLLIPVCCSPVHDKDVYSDEDVRNWIRRHIDPDTGEVADKYTNQTPKVGDPKKAHVHVILIVKGRQDRNYFTELMGDLVYVNPNSWSKVPHLDALTRYMAHMDNPEKAQYEPHMIKAWGGFNLKPISIVRSDEYSKYCACIYVTDYIFDNNIRYYHQIWKHVKDTGDIDLMSCVRGNSSHWRSVLDGIRQERIDKAEAKKRLREQGITET